MLQAQGRVRVLCLVAAASLAAQRLVHCQMLHMRVTTATAVSTYVAHLALPALAPPERYQGPL